MKRTLLAALLALLPTAAYAQIPGFTGTYTADLTCVAKSNAAVDAILAAQAPYLERGTTVTASGTHPVCALALKYDSVVFMGQSNGGPLEVAHIILDLKPKAGFTCPNAIGAPLMSPSTKVSFIPLMHQSDASYVAQSRFGYGYNAYLGTFVRNHVPGVTTQWTVAATTQGVPADNALTFQANFFWPVAVTNSANLAYLSAALDAPVFGSNALNQATGTFGPAWNVVTWNAGVNTTAVNANMSWQSPIIGSFVSSFVPSLNSTPLGAVHFEQTPFAATFPVNCTP